jgi:hypothetical protein
MFRGLVNDAKSAVGSLVARYLARASVAVPFLIAAGFVIAAITLMLVDAYGHITAYWMMAGGLAVIGAVASLVVTVKEQEEEVAEKAAEATDTSDAMTEAAVQAPLALVGALSALPLGPTSFMPIARTLGRNLPLVALIVLIGMLFWPSETNAQEGESSAVPDGDGEQPATADEDEERPVRHANGSDPLPSEMRH